MPIDEAKILHAYRYERGDVRMMQARRTLIDVPTALRERAFQYAHQHAPAIRTVDSTAAWTIVFYKYIHARILKWPTLDRHKREELHAKLEDMIATVVAEQVTGDNYDDPTTQD